MNNKFKTVILVIINFLNNFLWICYSLWVIFVILMIISNNYLSFIEITLKSLFLILPILIMLLCKKFLNEKSSLILMFAGIVFTIISITFFTIAGLFIMLTSADERVIPKMEEYPTEIQKLKKDYSHHDLSYIPDKIPANINNYYCDLTPDFHGYNTYYLKFDADKNYLEKIKEETKSRIIKITNIKELQKNDENIRINDLNNDYKIYLLKKSDSDDCDKCKFGYAIKDNTIYYFFQNF